MFFGIILATKVIAYTYTFHLCWMFIYKDVVLSYSYSNVFVVLPWSQIINFWHILNNKIMIGLGPK